MPGHVEQQDIATFRADVRRWIEDNCPEAMQQPVRVDGDWFWGGRDQSYASPDQRLWFDRVLAKRWTVPYWPEEYGGAGLSAAAAKVLDEEFSLAGVRPALSSFGIWMLGPALLQFGTEEQKRRFLPEIARGEIRWCQGYSEPGAGSDLAAVATSARDCGDHWLVNGQKVWTSYADKADWIFCLVRTNPQAPKRQGISFLMFDMRTPGVTTRPIKLISGSSPFCETFFDDVRVPKENIVGEADKGWTVAKYLLQHEREMVSTLGHDDAGPIGAGIATSPLLRASMAHFDVRAAAFRACGEQFRDEQQAGNAHPSKPSLLKYYGTELNKLRNNLTMTAGGSDALQWESAASTGGLTARTWLRSKGNSIEGGTSEIQLDIVARHILNLPNG